MWTVAVPNAWPRSVHVPAGASVIVGCGQVWFTPIVQAPDPGVNGVPHGTLSGSAAIGASESGARLVSRASIMRLWRSPGSVETGHGSGFAPPQSGVVTSRSPHTLPLPSRDPLPPP